MVQKKIRKGTKKNGKRTEINRNELKEILK